MPVAEIIREIDVYLSRLRKARALLAGSDQAAKRGGRMSKPAPVKAVKSAASGRNSKRPVRRRSGTDRPTSGAAGPDKSPNSSVAVAAIQLQPAQPRILTNSELPARRRPQPSQKKAAASSGRQSTHRRKPVTKPEIMKLATPLGGPVPSGVVVASPAEAQRARDRAVKREVRSDLLGTAPRTGKAAFEALFGSGDDPSGPSAA
jgi:hypothetical protein